MNKVQQLLQAEIDQIVQSKTNLERQMATIQNTLKNLEMDIVQLEAALAVLFPKKKDNK
jgi:predicted  nucleic acid-binding Zn-ribbon protein